MSNKNKEDPKHPYVYMGHINMFNKSEAGAELAVHLNNVMNHFHYKPGEQSGIVINGKHKDDNYKNRMLKYGIIVADDGTVMSRPEGDPLSLSASADPPGADPDESASSNGRPPF